MHKFATDLYVVCLWLLLGEALNALFESWWPSQHSFWEGTWTGGLVVAVLAALIVTPAAAALETRWGRVSDQSH
jgi:hypothetical protein